MYPDPGSYGRIQRRAFTRTVWIAVSPRLFLTRVNTETVTPAFPACSCRASCTITLSVPDPNHINSFMNFRVADIQECYELWKSRGAKFITEDRPHVRLTLGISKSMSRVDIYLPHGLNRLRHIYHACWITALRFTDDVASSNYPVFKGPATL
jgi:hypothetical protein